jgi:hypothetical protein
MAQIIEKRGKKCKVRAFLDEKDIEGGDSIPGSIRKNIRKCNEFLVLLSRNSKDRPWVLIEIGAAWVLGKRIIAIINNVAPHEMPEVIAPHKAIDLNNFNGYVDQLIKRAEEFGDRS